MPLLVVNGISAVTTDVGTNTHVVFRRVVEVRVRDVGAGGSTTCLPDLSRRDLQGLARITVFTDSFLIILRLEYHSEIRSPIFDELSEPPPIHFAFSGLRTGLPYRGHSLP